MLRIGYRYKITTNKLKHIKQTKTIELIENIKK